jgi:hypothetical protein
MFRLVSAIWFCQPLFPAASYRARPCVTHAKIGETMEMLSATLLQPQHIPLAGDAVVSAQDLAAHFRARARGVDARTAQERTKAFYRASATAWTLVLR